jgi:hypothetical protein
MIKAAVPIGHCLRDLIIYPAVERLIRRNRTLAGSHFGGMSLPFGHGLACPGHLRPDTHSRDTAATDNRIWVATRC